MLPIDRIILSNRYANFEAFEKCRISSQKLFDQASCQFTFSFAMEFSFRLVFSEVEKPLDRFP